MKFLITLIFGVALGAGAMHFYPKHDARDITPDQVAEAAPTAKAYMLVVGDVYDRAAFIEEYASKVAPFYEKYGGRYLAVGGPHDRLENGDEFGSYVIAEWPSAEAAMAFWNDPEYVALRDNRLAKGFSELDVYLLPGLPPSGD